MRIVSINPQYTTDEFNLAFNVDEPPRPTVVENIDYGVLHIGWRDGVLRVTVPEQETAFDASSVATLNRKIAEQEARLQREDERHARLMAQISASTGLPVGPAA